MKNWFSTAFELLPEKLALQIVHFLFSIPVIDHTHSAGADATAHARAQQSPIHNYYYYAHCIVHVGCVLSEFWFKWHQSYCIVISSLVCTVLYCPDVPHDNLCRKQFTEMILLLVIPMRYYYYQYYEDTITTIIIIYRCRI